MVAAEPHIRFRLQGISKTYGQRRWPRKTTVVTALGQVDLLLYEKQVNALVGPSGAGKSTLGRIVLQLEKPDQGHLFYREKPVEQVPLGIFRRHNQMVFQNPYLAMNPWHTVRRIVTEPLRVAGCSASEVREKIGAVAERVGLSSVWFQRRPDELSAGQLQRVALARALVLEPQFLVMDEPFSSLDGIAGRQMFRLLQGLIQALGLGLLYISHDLSLIHRLADWVALLHQGRLVEHLPADRFFSSAQHPVSRRLLALILNH